MTVTRGTSLPTNDPQQIRLWAASIDAMPAELLPGHVDAVPAHLHFFIPGDSLHQPRLRMIGWEDFFAMFKAQNLTFVYEILPDGRPGRRFQILQVPDEAGLDAEAKSTPDHDSDQASEVCE